MFKLHNSLGKIDDKAIPQKEVENNYQPLNRKKKKKDFFCDFQLFAIPGILRIFK